MNDRIPIAERTIFAVDKNGREFEIRAAVGVPCEAESNSWACPVCLEGLHDGLPDVYGVDSWQSLMIALKAIHNMLNYFVEEGGRLYWEKGGEEITIDELFDNDVEEPVPDGPPTEEQQERIDQLTAGHIQTIDEALIANASTQWRKVARVVGSAMEVVRDTVPQVPDIFYAERVRHLVADGRLASQGNLDYMRFSEIRLPDGHFHDDPVL